MTSTTSETSTQQYIYGKVLNTKKDNFGNLNTNVVVVKNKNYPGKVSEYNGSEFTYIKARHTEGKCEKGKYYRFLVQSMGEYMNKAYIKKYHIQELPAKMVAKYEAENKARWEAEQEAENNATQENIAFDEDSD